MTRIESGMACNAERLILSTPPIHLLEQCAKRRCLQNRARCTADSRNGTDSKTSEEA